MVVVFAGGKTAGHFHPARNIAEALLAVWEGGAEGAGGAASSGGSRGGLAARSHAGRRADGAAPSLFFVGAEGGIEARELPRLGYDHLLFPLRGLARPSGRGGAGTDAEGVVRRFAGAMAGNAQAVWLLCRAVRRLLAEFRRRRAAAVVLTGGYAAAPAGIAGILLRLPLALQEQNVHAGKTTRLMARWAAQIHVAHPEAAADLPRSARARAQDTGNPIRPLPPPSDRRPGPARAALGLPREGPVVLLVGGSQGARALNRAALEALPNPAPGGGCVLWVTGRSHYESLRRTVQERFDSVPRTGEGACGAGPLRERLRMVPYLEPEAMYLALAAATLAISRAGAMATSEFLAWGLPAILVPLPTAAADHQSRNAVALERAGAAMVVPERDDAGRPLSGERLWGAATTLLASPERLAAMSRAALGRARPGAAAETARAVASLLPARAGGVA